MMKRVPFVKKTFSRRLIEMERVVQRTWLHIQAYCDHEGYFDWGETPSFYEQERDIFHMLKRISNVRKYAESDEQLEMYAKELALLDQSAARLEMTRQMINAHLVIRTLTSVDDASIYFEHMKEAFMDLRAKFPFPVNDPLELPTIEMVYALMLKEYSSFITPKIMSSTQVTQSSKKIYKPDEMQSVLVKVERLLDVPSLNLKEVNDIEVHGNYSSEKVVQNLCELEGPGAHAYEWLNSFMIEKCKVSTRAVEIMQIVESLFEKLVNEKQTHAYSTTIRNVINMFMARAMPESHHGNDNIVYFNDCMYIVIELERHKSNFVSVLHQIVWDFNFNDLINLLRQSARSVLKKYLTFVQKQHFTWSDQALDLYVRHRHDEFAGVIQELDRFAKIWKDVCAKNTYETMVMIVCSGILLRTYKSLLLYDDYTNWKCYKAVMLVNKIIKHCNSYVQESMTTSALYQNATKRLNAVMFCFERSQHDIQQEFKKANGSRLRGLLTEMQIKHLLQRSV